MTKPTVIRGSARDLGGFSVRRILPTLKRRAVGPFVFFDHLGPAEFAAGAGIQVRPHPHINLATMTYLFEGEIIHRDSLGVTQPIRPGEVNWMVAGSGIVHSERTSPERTASGGVAHGLQVWLGLPTAQEETEPSFHHFSADDIPTVDVGGTPVRVVAGSAYGVTSPVPTHSPLFYAAADIERSRDLPLPVGVTDRAVYLVSGFIRCGGVAVTAPALVVIPSGSDAVVSAKSDARLVAFGGEPLDGVRHLWWNFVSSSKERIERAKDDWREGRFAQIADDADEFIPLPQES